MSVMDRNKSFLDLRKFLEDIYIYLNNQSAIEQNDGLHTEKPTDLINRCKDLLNIYEAENGSKSEQAYLDMNGTNKIDHQPCEYVDVTSPFIATVAEASTSLNDLTEIVCNERVNIESNKSSDFEASVECPFSGLPAAHLLIKKSPKVGNLQRIKEKTYIFNQSRMRFYSGVLDGWLLMYSTNGDLKPSICLNLQNYDLCNSDQLRKREQFQLISNECRTESPKKYLLQAASASDYEEWLQAITVATKSSLIRRRLNSISRKLPSPPQPSSPESETKPRLSDRSEGIYEEPSEMFSPEMYQSFLFDNWMKLPVAPTLPVKSGIAKCANECNDPESVAYDVPKSPPKPTVPNVYYQNKIQQVKTQLTMQMLQSPSKDKDKVFAKTPSPSMDDERCKEKSKKKSAKLEAPSETPVKFSKRKWFLNRLSGGRHMASSGKLKMEDVPSSEDAADSRIDAKRSGKVNMIINQLEANGHFQQRKEKFKDNQYLKLSLSNGENDEELHNYEPVAISGHNAK